MYAFCVGLPAAISFRSAPQTEEVICDPSEAFEQLQI